MNRPPIRLGEFDWIERYLAPLAGEGAFNLKDDAALLNIPDGHDLCITQDAVLEGIHFLPDDPVDTIAQKALRVNLSDCIAKGAKPFAYSLALGVPDRWVDKDMTSFCEGLRKDQTLFDLQLTGGDTYKSPDRLAVSVTLLGLVPNNSISYRQRKGANVGDLLVVTGTIGNAALGLAVVQGGLNAGDHAQELISAYRVPQPPLGFHIPVRHASASMDISDGLLGDARKLAQASNVSVVIEREKIPLSPAVVASLHENADLWSSVLTGGDDYQTLCTIAPDEWKALQSASAERGIEITPVGKVVESTAAPVTITVEGVAVSFDKDSYSHF